MVVQNNSTSTNTASWTHSTDNTGKSCALALKPSSRGWLTSPRLPSTQSDPGQPVPRPTTRHNAGPAWEHDHSHASQTVL